MDPILEVWLRGPIPGIQPYLQPAAHTLQQVREDIELAVQGLTTDQLWQRPSGAAAIGFHLHHLPGSLESLDDARPDLSCRRALVAPRGTDRDARQGLIERVVGPRRP